MSSQHLKTFANEMEVVLCFNVHVQLVGTGVGTTVEPGHGIYGRCLPLERRNVGFGDDGLEKRKKAFDTHGKNARAKFKFLFLKEKLTNILNERIGPLNSACWKLV